MSISDAVWVAIQNYDPMQDETEWLRAELAALTSMLESERESLLEWRQRALDTNAKLAKAVEVLRQIDNETFTDAPVASLHEIRHLVRDVLKELEK